MKYLRLCFYALIFLLLAHPAEAQKRKKKKAKEVDETAVYNQVTDQLKKHIAVLADDSLEGRRTGTRGEALAAAYISSQFAANGLQPRGDNNGFLQRFDMQEGRQYAATSFFYINDNTLAAGKEFFPLSFSANGRNEALASPILKESDTPWFLDLKEELQRNEQNPHYDITPYVLNKANDYATRGAKALLVYNSSKKADGLRFDPKERPTPANIPVIYISSDAVARFLKDESAMLDLKFNIQIEESKRSGTNVVGYLDNGAPLTVIIGAHFDHLGYGEDRNSLYAGKGLQIHNGADDNASGTAALIELAALLQKKEVYKKSNYLFIAFSGEELGLYGSKYYTEHPVADWNTVRYMINMDMVGRLNDSTRAITVGGYGTSPIWGELIKPGQQDYLTIKTDSSGTGPSDHTSFYRKNIPVLFFFTGTHSDYHKPTDDADKVNYEGEKEIIRYIANLVAAANERDKPAFTKTRENSSGSSSTRFTVSLGIMPDYTYNGGGVKIDGVSEGKLAQKLGLQAGDVLVQMGDFKLSSVENYMQALSKFKKGDQTKITVKRGDKEITYDVTF
jgi:aminopeptidase YwaD